MSTTVTAPYGTEELPPEEFEHEHDLELEEEVPDAPGRAETLILFVVSAVAFFVIGYLALSSGHVVVFDAIDRLNRAYLVWWNDPAKLAAIGFVFPPLTTMVFLPAAAIKPLATSLIALPVVSAFFAALTLVMLDRLFARCGMNVLFRLTLVVLFALNPLFVFYAGNGMSEAVYLAMLAFSLYCFACWYQTTQARYLIGTGLGMAVLLLTRYQFVVWALVMAVLIGAALIRLNRSRAEVEGSVIAYAAPVIYVLALWVLFNGVIIGDPFGWINVQQSQLAVNSAQIDTTGGATFADVTRRMLELLLIVSPLALIALPLLLIAFVARRNDMALWLASFIALGIVIVGTNALINNNVGLLTLRDAMPVMLAGVIGAAWLHWSFREAGTAIFAVTALVLAGTILLSWQGMKDYPYQNLEQAFTRFIETGKNQEGTSSRGGYQVGFDPELDMANEIKHQILPNPDKDRDAILTDNSQTYAVMLLNGRPHQFFDRADEGDAVWNSTLADPYGEVSYLLSAFDSNGDQVRQKYPRAVAGRDPSFPVVFRTDRYVLLRVPERQPRSTSTRQPSSARAAPAPSTTTTTTSTTATTPRPAATTTTPQPTTTTP